jgi:hypothetical protein
MTAAGLVGCGSPQPSGRAVSVTSAPAQVAQTSLFPADQGPANDAFVAGTESYTGATNASAGEVSAQGHASLSWFDGLSGPTATTWKATITSDASAGQKAVAGLRAALDVPPAR